MRYFLMFSSILLLFCASGCDKYEFDLNSILDDMNSKGEVFRYNENGEKSYFNVRKDRVIIKTESREEAARLCKDDIFLSAYDADMWVIGAIDPQKTTINDLLNIPLVLDATYGLVEMGGKTMCYPTNMLYAKFNKGYSAEQVFKKLKLTEYIVSISPYNSTGYNIIINADLKNILNICRYINESDMCFVEPTFMLEIPLIYWPTETNN